MNAFETKVTVRTYPLVNPTFDGAEFERAIFFLSSSAPFLSLSLFRSFAVLRALLLAFASAGRHFVDCDPSLFFLGAGETSGLSDARARETRETLSFNAIHVTAET